MRRVSPGGATWAGETPVFDGTFLAARAILDGLTLPPGSRGDDPVAGRDRA